MNTLKKKIPNIEALTIIEESIKEGNSVRITVRGNSMSPQLIDGKDIVTLKSFTPDNLKVNDIILFVYTFFPLVYYNCMQVIALIHLLCIKIISECENFFYYFPSFLQYR